ncbi:MAG TPA: sigma-54 dependent transcriptional regulator [Planctomycetota bacterium]|nr:sigma-54 dependent transcriptional regulator [Planctomycetota bacterium]
MRGRILIVDDDAAMCGMVETALQRRDFAATSSASAEAGLARLHEADYDVVVTDLRMRSMGGIEFCSRVVAARPDVPVVVMTAFGSLETAVQAIRAGAYDFLTKPFEVEVLVLTLDRAVAYRSMRAELRRLREQIDRSTAPGTMVGDSAPMRALFEVTARVAATDSNVLIVGETGTGKELVARALHAGSGRASGPFVAVNCASIPEALIESELFGHVRGAFTDARAPRLGLFQQADRGTLFLDEVGELSAAMQPKLLRVLQEQRVRPVGSDTEVGLDVRVLAATHRDLETEVEQGRFREDLFYRLDVVQIDVPALRARGNDVLVLAQSFVAAAAARLGKPVAGITPAAARLLLAYPWPGNVRELENAIERAVTWTDYTELLAEDLPPKVRSYEPSHVLAAADALEDFVPLAEVERRYVLRVIEAAGGNRTLAAKVLGLDRKTLYRKLQQYGAP